MAESRNIAVAIALALGVLAAAGPAVAWDRGQVDVLAVLPDATPGMPSSVEGLTVGPDGNSRHSGSTPRGRSPATPYSLSSHQKEI
jgi:hypothetical protein